MYVCLYAYGSKKDTPLYLKLGTLVPWKQEDILEKLKLRKMSGIRVPVNVARKQHDI
jgi:hypothetical protein